MWRLAPTLASVVGAVVYLVLGPRSPDLAAHVFRSELFGREGFTIWNGQWYAGHHTPASRRCDELPEAAASTRELEQHLRLVTPNRR
ncbi:MAG: hypothetical protein M3350_08815 [Actinomycetota bacterium]|nr:hypothetical protein [Actinomycetota bacterium]